MTFFACTGMLRHLNEYGYVGWVGREACRARPRLDIRGRDETYWHQRQSQLGAHLSIHVLYRSTLGASMTTPPSATCPPRVVEEDIYLDSSANVGLLD